MGQLIAAQAAQLCSGSSAAAVWNAIGKPVVGYITVILVIAVLITLVRNVVSSRQNEGGHFGVVVEMILGIVVLQGAVFIIGVITGCGGL